MAADMTISRAAERAGVGVETIRFYERRGLIAQPARPRSGGYRFYDDEVVERIRFIPSLFFQAILSVGKPVVKAPSPPDKESTSMNTLSRFVLAALAAAWFTTAALAAGPSYRIEVAGLACPFCAYGIEKKLNAVQGVGHLETNIKVG